MAKRTIAIVTGSRAESSLFRGIIHGIQNDSDFVLQIIATGSHLSDAFGMTVHEIEKDGVTIAARIPILEDVDTPVAITHAMANAMRGFGDVYEKMRPDIVVVLGDRFEIFAAVAATVPLRIPVAHIHGGEITEGAMDEQFRHAITKMSHLHFTSTEIYRRRVIQMGEDPDRVWSVGAPGVDNIASVQRLSRKEFCQAIGIPQTKRIGAVAYHPVTLTNADPEESIEHLLNALIKFPEIFWVFSGSNADPGGKRIMECITAFSSQYPQQAAYVVSLGMKNYLSLLEHADLMVGNSSSGIIEAPSFRLPVVNIGDRQKGRVRARNVMDVPDKTEAIAAAIAKCLTQDFRNSLRDLVNPYGNGRAGENIVAILKTHSLGNALLRKAFYDMVGGS